MMIQVFFNYTENSILKSDTVKLGLDLNKSIDLEDTINGYLDKGQRFKAITKILPLEDYGDEVILTINYSIEKPDYVGMTTSRFLVKQGATMNLRKLAESHCNNEITVIEVISANITTDIKDFDKLTQVAETAVVEVEEPKLLDVLITAMVVNYDNEKYLHSWVVQIASLQNSVIQHVIVDMITPDKDIWMLSHINDIKVIKS